MALQVKWVVAHHLEMQRAYKVKAVRHRLEKVEVEVEVAVVAAVAVVKEVVEK